MVAGTVSSIQQEVSGLLEGLGVSASAYSEGELAVKSPITGEVIGQVPVASKGSVGASVETAHRAFLEWRKVPAPRRGELVRLLGEELRAEAETLGRLVTIETGKLLSEGIGEVQEMIDICTFAAGLSRQLAGLTIASERRDHRMMETW